MNYPNRQPPNLITQVVGLIVGVGLFVLAVVIGGVVLAGILGLGLIAWLVISARLWWLRRNAERRQGADGRIVEAEYRVVEVIDRDERTEDQQP